LSSWVPEWKSAPETVTGAPFEKTVEGAGRKLLSVYHASGERLPFGGYRPMITDEELRLYGFHLDLIETLHQSPGYTDSNRKDVEKSWMPKDKNALYMHTGKTMEKAYLCTIVEDFHLFPAREPVSDLVVLPWFGPRV